MEPQATELTKDDDLKSLLKSILSELKSIGVSVVQHGEQIKQLQADRPIENTESRKTEAACVSVSPNALP